MDKASASAMPGARQKAAYIKEEIEGVKIFPDKIPAWLQENMNTFNRRVNALKNSHQANYGNFLSTNRSGILSWYPITKFLDPVPVNTRHKRVKFIFNTAD
jgi:hypothetical protein